MVDDLSFMQTTKVKLLPQSLSHLLGPFRSTSHAANYSIGLPGRHRSKVYATLLHYMRHRRSWAGTM